MGYENTQYEEIVDFPLLIAGALRKWKLLVAAVLVGAILFGGYRGVLRPQNVGSSGQIAQTKTAIDTCTADLAAAAGTIETNNDSIALNQSRIAENEKFLESYQASQAMIEQMRTTLEDALTQMREILSDPSATAAQRTQAAAQLPELSEKVLEINDWLGGSAQQIRTAQNEILTWQREIKTAAVNNEKLALTMEQQQTRLGELEAELVRLSGRAGLKPTVVYAAIGGILGGCVFCVAILLGYLMSRKLRSAKELKERYGLPVLGEFRSAVSGKRCALVDALTGDRVLPEADEQVYALIAAGIQAAVEQPVQLAVTGTVEEAVLQDVGSRLSGLLPAGFVVTVAANPMYNPRLLTELKQCAVLVVEQRAASDKRKIDKMTELLRRGEANILGAVVK